jgi:hypothetical protein
MGALFDNGLDRCVVCRMALALPAAEWTGRIKC